MKNKASRENDFLFSYNKSKKRSATIEFFWFYLQ